MRKNPLRGQFTTSSNINKSCWASEEPPEHLEVKRVAAMEPNEAIDLGRQALWTGLLIGSPVLVIGMFVGLLIGLLQALTQIQEQTVAFVPKIVAMVLALSVALPWLIARMLQYSTELITSIPTRM